MNGKESLPANGGPLNGDCDRMSRKRLEESAVLLVWKKVAVFRWPVAFGPASAF
jgi:hypothetical protein